MRKENAKDISLLLVGSHGATTAAAVIEEIQRRNLNWNLYWIGKKWSTERKKSLSLEYQILPSMGIEFLELESGKIQTKFTRHTIPALLKIPMGIIQSIIYLIRVKPNLILSFGGASGGLISFWAGMLNIPLIIHEQTSAAGRANLKAEKYAKIITVSRESSIKYFRSQYILITGNPISSNIKKFIDIKPRKKVETILITGGSRGSAWINNAIKPILPDLCARYLIIHQTGLEDYAAFKDLKIKNYKAISQVTPHQMLKLISSADIIVSRAGANTITELIALKKPSILIPIPWSYLDEQLENAKHMQGLGLAKILPQKDLTPTNLKNELDKLIKIYPRVLKETADLKSNDLEASEKLVDILVKNV